MSENILPAQAPPAALGAGLDPVRAQQVYRAVLEAFARPGSRQLLPPSHFPPALLPMLALADLETGTHLIEGDDGGWGPVLAVATGAPAVSQPRAKYVTALAPVTAATVARMHTGTARSPESGATLVLAVDSLDGGDPVRLTGPGLRTECEFAPRVIDPEIWAAREEKVAEFPAGIDLRFVARDGSLVGIPRTTAVTHSYRDGTDPRLLPDPGHSGGGQSDDTEKAY